MSGRRGAWAARAIFAAWVAAYVAAAAALPTIQDEAYYWTWSRAPALTYFDHPPAIAWVMAASTRVWGDGPLGLRMPSMVAAAVVLAAAAAGARRLGAPRVTPLLLGAPMFAVGYVPGTHDALLGAALAVAGLWVLRAMDEPRWSGPAAFLLIASALIKHAAAVVAVGVLLGLCASRRGRARLGQPAPWIGVVLGLAAVAPWLVAEVSAQGGGSIAFQAAHVLDYAPPRPWLGAPLALGSIALTLGPVAGVAVWPAAAWALRRADEHPGAAALAGGALALLVACVLTVIAGSGEANWPMPALALSAPMIARYLEASPSRARAAWPLAWASAVVSVGLLVHAAWPWLPARPSRDPTLRGAGFDAIAAAAAGAAEAGGARALITRRYQPASLLRYHTRDRWPLVELGSDRRQSQYDRWPRPPLCAGDRALWIGPDPALPRELSARVDGPAIRVPRRARPGGVTIDVWWVQPLVMEAAAPWSACP